LAKIGFYYKAVTATALSRHIRLRHKGIRGNGESRECNGRVNNDLDFTNELNQYCECIDWMRKK
jgi:hypothetical protein